MSGNQKKRRRRRTVKLLLVAAAAGCSWLGYCVCVSVCGGAVAVRVWSLRLDLEKELLALHIIHIISAMPCAFGETHARAKRLRECVLSVCVCVFVCVWTRK